MTVKMSRLRIIGLKSELMKVLRILRDLGCVQIDSVADAPEMMARPLSLEDETLQKQEMLRSLRAEIEGLLDTLNCKCTRVDSKEGDLSLGKVRLEIDELKPEIDVLLSRKEELESERATLPRYEATLRKLQTDLPSSARDPNNRTIGILLNRQHHEAIDFIYQKLYDITHSVVEIVTKNVDESTEALLLVFPERFTEEVEALLGEKDVTRLKLPEEYREGTPDVALAAIQRRISAIPYELEKVEGEIKEVGEVWCVRLCSWKGAIQKELQVMEVLNRFGETETTFILVGWAPSKELENVQSELDGVIGETLIVEELPISKELKKDVPVVLQNPKLAQPFESLVKLLSIPTYDGLDPTMLMAIFLPVIFGMILGDAGYGTILLLLSLFLMRKFQEGIGKDIIKVLAFGSGWSILFGLLYGEVFGTLGEHLGMHPLWFDRADEDVTSLLILSIVVGGVHIALGLALGVWQAVQEKSRSHLLERGGMLLGLVSLFVLVGTVVEYLPPGFMTPAIAGIIVGIGFLGASSGWLGLFIGPIEFISLIGNVLSYLRIAAIGLASVYLARVANELAGVLGSILVGGIIAVLIHTLNVALGAFSPTIHSMRLHYVEFFRKFYEGGGRAYKPFQ